MKIRRVTYLALGAFVCAVSCSKEAAEPDVFEWADGNIYFRTSLSDLATSRAQDMTLERLESFQVTCFNTADSDTDPSGHLSPYFENATFIRKTNSPTVTTYVSSPAEGTRDWPANNGLLRFFAFSPSLAVMAGGSFINTSVGNGSSATVGYRLGNVRINPDISRQFDFVTAEAAGERWKDFSQGIELAFSHQLCQVELKAWGDASDYDFEIAGVRIGNPVVEGTFVFADDDTPVNAGKWAKSDKAVKDKVEYLYCSPGTSNSGELPATGDRIFRINSKEHNTPESAASIMGKGGCAMVIPTVNTAWEGTADPNIGSVPYKTDRMYFSVLLRASQAGTPLYPYAGNPNGMTVIYYAVDREGTIISRLYPGDENGEYFTDPDHKTPYTATDGVEVKDFGWAAISVDADWSAGKRYVYTLNYSEGIGMHDPADPEPGKPIVGKSSISWGVSVGSWDYATADENYTPDVEVP
ncbi:MAG: fimbrillin family protein [Muribaculaceae bacterium]|nr:fimbrillin family protein [Muribaculaceae bacterium]